MGNPLVGLASFLPYAIAINMTRGDSCVYFSEEVEVAVKFFRRDRDEDNKCNQHEGH